MFYTEFFLYENIMPFQSFTKIFLLTLPFSPIFFERPPPSIAIFFLMPAPQILSAPYLIKNERSLSRLLLDIVAVVT